MSSYGKDMYRKTSAASREWSLNYAAERMAQPNRKCPVPECTGVPKSYSRYCQYHNRRLKENGHPVLHLPVNTRPSYEKALKVGRWVREASSRDDESNRRAWMRVEEDISRIATDPKYSYGIPVLAIRDKHWKNAFKARCLMARKLNLGTPAEELLAAFLGYAATILIGNEVNMKTRQIKHCFHKAGGRAIARYLKGVARDPVSYRVYRWNPGFGVLTETGRIIDDAISAEFGAMWFKDIEVKLIVAVGGDPEALGDLEVDLRDGKVAREFNRATSEANKGDADTDATADADATTDTEGGEVDDNSSVD